jgi:hypothetical protein
MVDRWYLVVLELHGMAPPARDFPNIGGVVADSPRDGIICSREEALLSIRYRFKIIICWANLGFELEVTVETVLLVLGHACVAKLLHHLSKEDAARVHVWHGNHVFCMGGAAFERG